MTHVIATIALTAPFVLAEGGGGGGGGGGGSAPTGGGPQTLFFGLIMAMVVFYVIMFRGSSKEKKERKAMLENLAKNDRVLTIGGIIGTVVAVKGDEIVVKVDESTKTKMTFTRTAIQKVLTEEGTDAEKK